MDSNKNKHLFLIAVLAFVFSRCSHQALAKSPQFDTSKIEEITGLKGTYNDAEGTFKVSAPRSDVKVAVDTIAMPPFMGLTSWTTFVKGGKADLMVMGDLVLFQDEVNKVMSSLLESGLEVTALHNHFFYDEPKVYFMHIAGEGELDTLAKGIKHAFDTVKEIRAAKPKPSSNFGYNAFPSNSSISAKPIEDILGQKVLAQNGMAKAVIGRKTAMPCGCEVGKEMGVNTWAAFMGTDNDAIVDGDFAVHENELQEVLKTLRKADINIVAIHHHMTNETPRTLFLHYWGRGTVQSLAKGVKAALDTQK